MKARCFCPKHGKLSLEEISIIDGSPVCSKCRSVLEFCEVRPRRVEKATKKRRRRKKKSKR